MTALFYFTMTVFLLICFILIALILIQKGRGGGLASAFGGAGGQTAFGSKTGDVLTWATSIVFAIFVALAVCLNLICNHINNKPGAGVVIPVVANTPAAPSIPDSNSPPSPWKEPQTANPPPTTQETAPTTMPAAVQHVVDRVPVATTFPTTLP